MEEEQRETFAHLEERVGLTVDQAERAMRDDDLWVVPPELRLDVPDEEAVEEWRTAIDVLEPLVHVGNNIGLGVSVALGDAHWRGSIALERARERARQAREDA
jgi:hypothetical protein